MTQSAISQSPKFKATPLARTHKACSHHQSMPSLSAAKRLSVVVSANAESLDCLAGGFATFAGVVRGAALEGAVLVAAGSVLEDACGLGRNTRWDVSGALGLEDASA